VIYDIWNAHIFQLEGIICLNIIHDTEAAAATIVFMNSYSFKAKQKKVFNASHDFIFYIREKSNNLMLFVGTFEG